MRGRKPKPVEQRAREGNPGRRPLPEPVNFADLPENMQPPDDLPETARQLWAEVVPVLQKVGLVDAVDRAALELLTVQYARAKQAGRVLAEEGTMDRGSTGQMVEHPMVATERNAATAFLRFAEQYALTPVARTRLGLAELQRRELADEMGIGEPELKAA